MKWYLFPLCFAILFLGCDKDDGPGSFRAEQQSSEIIFIDGQIQLDVTSNNGNLKVVSSDTATNVYLEIKKIASSTISTDDANSHIDDIQITYDTIEEVAVVLVEYPENNGIDYAVDFNITTPEAFDYTLILGNGNIDVRSFSNKILVEQGNGNLSINSVLTNNCFMNLILGNGSAFVTIPNATNAYVNITVGNGIIVNEGLTINNAEFGSNYLYGTMGNGNGTVKATIGNGNVSLTPK